MHDAAEYRSSIPCTSDSTYLINTLYFYRDAVVSTVGYALWCTQQQEQIDVCSYLIRLFSSVCVRVWFPGQQHMMTVKTNGWNVTRLPDKQTHTHTHTTSSDLGYNMASVHPCSTARSKSNILPPPHVAWPLDQVSVEITHHAVTLSVCLPAFLSASQSVTKN